jgi:hypothetical protein
MLKRQLNRMISTRLQKRCALTPWGGAGTAKRPRPLVGAFALNSFGSFLFQERKEQARTAAGMNKSAIYHRL